MATAKKRINITVLKLVDDALEKLSKRDQVPIASKASELLRLAIEIEEDQIWDAVASARLKRDRRRVAHKNAWK